MNCKNLILPLLAGLFVAGCAAPEGDYAAGKALVERYAVKVDLELHKEVKERYDALKLKPYGGFINPVITPMEEEGKIVDYRVEYPSDFLAEHLDLGKNYSFLTPTH